MEFKIKQPVLKDALAAVQGALEKKGTMPILSNVLIESIGENNIQVTATDTEITIRKTAAADIIQSGKICVAADKLMALANNIAPTAEITLETERNHWGLLSSGKIKVRLAGHDPETWPEIAVAKSAPAEIDAAGFFNALSRTGFIAAKAKSHRFDVQSVKVEAADGILRLISTDGSRLAWAETECEADLTLDTTIPRRAFGDIARLTAEKFRFGEDPKNLFFETDDTLMVVRKDYSNFPKWRLAMPKDCEFEAAVGRDELLAAAKRASAFADSEYSSIYFAFTPEGLELWSRTIENGEIDESIPLEYSGPLIEKGCQYPFLIDLCGLAPAGSKIRCHVSPAERGAMLFSIDGDSTFEYVVMPTTVKHSKRAQIQEAVAA